VSIGCFFPTHAQRRDELCTQSIYSGAAEVAVYLAATQAYMGEVSLNFFLSFPEARESW